jgi:hypothetical protein
LAGQQSTDVEGIYWQASFPQMYMQALLGPATLGLQMPLVQLTVDSMPVEHNQEQLILRSVYGYA